MREYSMPSAVTPTASGNLTDDVVRRTSEAPDRVAFRVHGGDGWRDVTIGDFEEQVRAVAKGLVASGVEPGDRVALMSRTRYEWTVVDYAIWFAGAVGVPLYETAPDEYVHRVLADAGASVIVVGRQSDVARVEEAGPEGVRVWCLDDGGLDRLAAAGREVSDDLLEERRRSAAPDSPATVIYTSGATGTPKGCVLSHHSLALEVDAAAEALPGLFDRPDAATLLVLPLAHVFARVVQVGAVRTGVSLGHASDVHRMLADIREFRPTFLLAVPRLFEKLFTTASQAAVIDGRGGRFDRAAATAIAWSRALDGGGPSPALRARHRYYDGRVYAGLRAALGGRCDVMISGGAPLGERLGHFYRGIGMPVLEGYGLTETTAAVTVNRPSAHRVGTVGQPLGGVTVRVADDGELLVRGGQVMTGYWGDEQGTREALSDDGWLLTGDLAEIDDEGFVRITGRKKDVLVTAGGKNVSPGPLEERIRAHELVSQCLVVGDNRPYVAALVTLDPDAVQSWARRRDKTGDPHRLARDPDLLAELQSAVDAANAQVSQAEAVRRFAVLPQEWTEDAGHLTPSLKLRRGHVERLEQAEIERLYRG